MTGLRTYTTLDPNVFRWPQWKNNIFYPTGSFVGVATPAVFDSEQIVFSYYVNTQDVADDNKTDSAGNVIVNGGSWAPNDSDSDWSNHSIYGGNPWALAFDTTATVLDPGVLAQLAALSALYPLIGIDSDIAILYKNDSDFRVKDSEQDSDLLMEIHDRKAADSELQIQIFDNDSDILMEIHDRMAVDSDHLKLIHDTNVRIDSDSDRLTNFIHRYEERDSDIELKFDDHDSDIQYLRENMATGSASGFPVGAIVAFAHTTMPQGFRLADGSTFNTSTYPDLFVALGSNRLPDLRNQFIRGWNDDSDGFGNTRLVTSQQDEDFKSHRHSFNRDTGGAGGSGGDTGNGANSLRFTNFEGGDETRPVNVMLAFGIAMYNGAGIVADSDILTGILNEYTAKFDSDVDALYNRTNYYSETFAPATNQPAGTTYTIGVDSADFDDITVFLNGVAVSQWTVLGNQFTFNFLVRGNLDEVIVKLRR